MDEYLCKTGITLFACLSNFKFGKYILPNSEYVTKESDSGEVVTQKMSGKGVKHE